MLCVNGRCAGPPFNTDAPQPVDYKHLEFYISSINTYQSKTWTGTSPHVEGNYGTFPNVQVHLLLPIKAHMLGCYVQFIISDKTVGNQINSRELNVYAMKIESKAVEMF